MRTKDTIAWTSDAEKIRMIKEQFWIENQWARDSRVSLKKDLDKVGVQEWREVAHFIHKVKRKKFVLAVKTIRKY